MCTFFVLFFLRPLKLLLVAAHRGEAGPRPLQRQSFAVLLRLSLQLTVLFGIFMHDPLLHRRALRFRLVKARRAHFLRLVVVVFVCFVDLKGLLEVLLGPIDIIVLLDCRV